MYRIGERAFASEAFTSAVIVRGDREILLSVDGENAGCLWPSDGLTLSGNRQPLICVAEFEGGDIALVDADALNSSPPDGEWVSMRECYSRLQAPELMLASRAVQLQGWLRSHRFCGRCGKPLRLSETERALHCNACDSVYYPRISPCVIGVIVRGQELLLARNARHPEGMFSAIAGFIEPGETAEEAFHREVGEEVGLRVRNVRYQFSQAWPFPGQLMLGFQAEHCSGNIQVDNQEILEAHWFHYQKLPKTPPTHTIAGRLIQQVIEELG